MEVSILVDQIAGGPAYEQIPVQQIGENRYQLVGSPGFAAGLAAGDEIELSPEEPVGYRILNRSKNVCIQVFLTTLTVEERQNICNLVESIDGFVDGGYDGSVGNLLIFTVSVSIGFPAIETVMSRVSNEFAVDKWMYGNVYDVNDGQTPLNWWLQQ